MPQKFAEHTYWKNVKNEQNRITEKCGSQTCDGRKSDQYQDDFFF